jgi:hypothetical protein
MHARMGACGGLRVDEMGPVALWWMTLGGPLKENGHACRCVRGLCVRPSQHSVPPSTMCRACYACCVCRVMARVSAFMRETRWEEWGQVWWGRGGGGGGGPTNLCRPTWQA